MALIIAIAALICLGFGTYLLAGKSSRSKSAREISQITGSMLLFIGIVLAICVIFGTV